MIKKDVVVIPAQIIDEAFRAMTAMSSLLHAATYHKHDITLIMKSLHEMGGLAEFDRKAGALFNHLSKERQAALMDR